MTFETFLTPSLPRSTRWRRLTYALSLALHGALLLIGVAASFWRVDEISPPTTPITLGIFSPPPPPPPPLGSRKSTTPRTRTRAALEQPPPPRPTEAPTTAPTTEATEATEGPIGDPDGDPDGLPDGIGVGEAPPRFIPPTVARGQLAIDPQKEPYRVRLPPALATAGMTVWALVKICARTNGTVSEVKLLKSADPALDPTIVAVLSTWRYQPYTLDGRPVPFCTTVRYNHHPLTPSAKDQGDIMSFTLVELWNKMGPSPRRW